MLSFGVGSLTVSGVAIARLHNISVNISYDNALLRGGSRIFPDHCALYNGNIEGTFEAGDVELSSIAEMLGADKAATSVTVTSIHAIATGMDLIFSGSTNAISCTVTLFNCMIPAMTLNFDRENYTMPSTNFIVAGETSASGGRVMKIET